MIKVRCLLGMHVCNSSVQDENEHSWKENRCMEPLAELRKTEFLWTNLQTFRIKKGILIS